MSSVFLGLGSNVDAETNLRAGVAALRGCFGGLRLSPVYRSIAVGFEGNDFLNLAAAIDTDMQPLALKDFLNLFVPVRRYRCKTSECHWQGLRVSRSRHE